MSFQYDAESLIPIFWGLLSQTPIPVLGSIKNANTQETETLKASIMMIKIQVFKSALAKMGHSLCPFASHQSYS